MLRFGLILMVFAVAIAWPAAAQVADPATQYPRRSEATTVAQPSDEYVKSSKKKHPKDHSIGNWYSLESEIKMGRQYAAEIDASTKLLDDPVVTEYVNRLGQNLVRNCDASVAFTIKVIDSDEVNAFALPGGFMYVNTGLVLAAEDEAELAGVMAHEIAHVVARHATRQKTRSNIFSLASIPLIFFGGGVGYAARSIASVAGPVSAMKFSRGFEMEADSLGLDYAYRAGYDPLAFISFFERVQAYERKNAGFLNRMFMTHPPTADRVKKSQQLIAQSFPPREAYIITTSEFDLVKTALASRSLRIALEQDVQPKPTLKKRPIEQNRSTEDDSATSPNQERPTLKRRPN